MPALAGVLYFRNVRTGRTHALGIWNPANGAVGSYVGVDWNVPASANSPTVFSVPDQYQAIDFVPMTATGQVEFTSDGIRTQVVLDYALFPAAAGLGGRPISMLPLLNPGRQYRLLVVSVLPA